jgi:hypothetical protein
VLRTRFIENVVAVNAQKKHLFWREGATDSKIENGKYKSFNPEEATKEPNPEKSP